MPELGQRLLEDVGSSARMAGKDKTARAGTMPASSYIGWSSSPTSSPGDLNETLPGVKPVEIRLQSATLGAHGDYRHNSNSLAPLCRQSSERRGDRQDHQ